MLSYLACAPGRTAQREHLINLLWADLAPDPAAHALRQTVWYIRQRTGRDLLSAGAGQLTLIADIATDRDDFLAAFGARQFDRAVDAYGGDFVPGFAAPGGAEFEKWADNERRRLRGMFIQAATALCRAHLATGRLRDAVVIARRARDTDTESEHTWRLLIESLVAAGDAVGTATEADALERYLRDERRDPEPATRVTLRAARHAPDETDTAPAPAAMATGLFGRAEEFNTIVSAWADAQRGRGRHIHITGAAGLGKSRLLGDAHNRLRATGARCVTLRANPGERHLPFTLLSDLAGAIGLLPGAMSVSPATAGTLVSLNPSLSSRFASAGSDASTGDEAARRRLLALEETLKAVADEAPFALFIDDIHWADAASRQILGGLVARLAAARTLIITSARPVPEGIVDRGDSDQLVLLPLTLEDTANLVSSLATLDDSDWARRLPARLLAASQGSPLLMLETLQLAIEREVLGIVNGEWRSANPAALIAVLDHGGALRIRVQDLERAQDWILLLLACAGLPLSHERLATAAGQPADRLDTDVADLERKGLVVRLGADFMPWHDALAEMAIDLAVPAAKHAAHIALGNAYRSGSASDEQLLRAGMHYAAAGDVPLLVSTFATWARGTAARRVTPLRELARQFLGEKADEPMVRALIRGLPLHVRAGLRTPLRAAAALATLAAASAIFAIQFRALAPPDAQLLIAARDSAGPSALYEVGVSRADWGRIRNLRMQPSARGLPVDLATVQNPQTPALSPDGTQWLYGRATADGIIDVFTTSVDHPAVRLTSAAADDNDAHWSPDARDIAFTTGRYSAFSQYQVVTMNLAHLDSVQRLTRSDASEWTPLFSPDGSRIAYGRRYLLGRDERSNEICVIARTGGVPRCFVPDGFEPRGLVAWRDASHLIAVGMRDTTAVIALVNLNEQTVRVLIQNSGIHVIASYDGRWLAFDRQTPSRAASSWFVAQVDEPDRIVPVRLPETVRQIAFAAFVNTKTDGEELRSLRILAHPETVALATSHSFIAQARDQWDNDIEPRDARWSISDTSVAIIDEQTGTLSPRAIGTIRIRLDAGGLHDSTSIVIGPRRDSVLIRENWRAPLKNNVTWRAYGTPLPMIVRHRALGPAFLNNGEGSFSSGVYSLARFDAREGLGIEAVVSVPVTMRIWQQLSIELTAAMEEDSLRTWDHHTNNLPVEADASRLGCSIGAPIAERNNGSNGVVLAAGNDLFAWQGPSWLGSGRPYRIRLQLFPDGRCGFSVNGRPIAILATRVHYSRPYRVNLSGNSAATQILVGPMEVWRGVRGDVHWAELDSAATAARSRRP